MIKTTCLEKEYIRKKSQEINADPILVERVIFAFELLSLLIKEKVPLIFKGGTSLMLLIPELRRLSIDVDIVTETEDAIMHPIFKVEEEIEVTVPSVNSIAGDKLTAFAPKTIGIPYGRGKSMEIIKQLFDLGILFEHISDLREVYDSYRNVAGLEAQYRSLDTPFEEFLNDSIETSFLICQSGFKGCVDSEETKELNAGIKRIKSHVLRGKYSLLQAKGDASKVAFLASLMRDGRLDIDFEEIRKSRNDLDKVKKIVLAGNYNILNKLKKISPSSFYLWAFALEAI